MIRTPICGGAEQLLLATFFDERLSWAWKCNFQAFPLHIDAIEVSVQDLILTIFCTWCQEVLNAHSGKILRRFGHIQETLMTNDKQELIWVWEYVSNIKSEDLLKVEGSNTSFPSSSSPFMPCLRILFISRFRCENLLFTLVLCNFALAWVCLDPAMLIHPVVGVACCKVQTIHVFCL